MQISFDRHKIDCSLGYIMQSAVDGAVQTTFVRSKPRRQCGVLVAMLVGTLDANGERLGEKGARVPPDKSGYSLFKPTPRQFMRELTTDRPDQTESPYTVDAGHFQVKWISQTGPSIRRI